MYGRRSHARKQILEPKLGDLVIYKRAQDQSPKCGTLARKQDRHLEVKDYTPLLDTESSIEEVRPEDIF